MKRRIFAKIIAAAGVALTGLPAVAQTAKQEKPMIKTEAVKLNSGFAMPALGLGTWTLTGATCENAVYEALKRGYRLIDTAKYYGNEREVGRGIARAVAEGIVTRAEVFVTSKLVPWTDTPDADIDDSLAKLGLDYIDLFLLHQHGANDNAVYQAMERAVRAGKVRSIGISNFYTPREVAHFIDRFDIPPAVVQNENHIFHQSNSLRDWCRKHGIFVESWYPFGGRAHAAEHMKHPTVVAIARAHGKTPAQVILRWHLQAGYIAVPGSGDPAHIAENFAVWDFTLTDEDMARFAALNRQRRYENW
ncbi:MAG: aldo/keto reductase [Rhodocyclaceae bacterium]|nr:aldo/keto reductase [Rhodocyclaceae bacterium]